MSQDVQETGLHCLDCDYNLTGLDAADRCPECGWHIDRKLLEFAREVEPAQTRRVVLAAWCVSLGLFFGVPLPLSSLFGSLGFVPGPKLALAGPSAIVLLLCTVVAGSYCLAFGWRLLRPARVWPLPHSFLSRSAVVAAIAQIIAAAIWIMLRNASQPMGLFEAIVLFVPRSICAWMLLLTVSIAFGAKPEVLRRLKSEYKRRPDMRPIGAPITIEAAGRFTRDDVTVTWTDEVRHTHLDLEAVIAETWTERTRMAEEKGQLLFNGSVGRLVSATQRDSQLELAIGHSDYRDFVGTNIFNAQLLEKFGADYFSNPLGTSAIIVTADGYLLFGRRSERVLCHAGYMHTFGGMIEPEDRRPDGAYDVFAAVAREVAEELHIAEDEIDRLICTGLARDIATYQPELLFDAHVKMTKRQVLERFAAHDDEEHTAIEACEDLPEAIAPFIGRMKTVVPVAQAALMLHGRCTFGHDWYENNSYLIFGDLPQQTATTQ